MTSKKHEVPEELLASLLADYKKPEDLIGENGLLKQLTKLLVEKALDAELTEHLGHERHETVANPGGNTRNGKSKKTLKGEFGELPIEVPRDRHGSFEPQLIPKHQTHLRHIYQAATAEEAECLRRSKSEPPCRLNSEPGVEADAVMVGCG
jgi:putative transposase